MRMQFREQMDFIYIKPQKHLKKGEKAKINAGDTISTYGRLAYPTDSQIRAQRMEIEDNTSALYHVRYTKELDPILQSPQSWKVKLYQHPKLKHEDQAVISADLDMRGKMVEVRI